PGFRPKDAGDHSRNNVAAYVDLSNDITAQLLIDVAGRVEHYTDFGSTTTGKVSGRYEPVKGFAFRGAVSSGFRAPSLGQEFFTNAVATKTDGIDVVTNYGYQISRNVLAHVTAGYNGNWTVVTRVDTSTVLGGHSDQLFSRVDRARLEKGNPRNNFVFTGNLS